MLSASWHFQVPKSFVLETSIYPQICYDQNLFEKKETMKKENPYGTQTFFVFLLPIITSDFILTAVAIGFES